MNGLLLTWLITAAGVGLSVLTPYYGFLAYVALALLKPEAIWSHSVSAGRYSLIVALAMLVSWGLRGFGNWKLGRARPVVFSFIGFWSWCAFLATRAPDQALAWNYVEAFTKILLPFLVGITTFRSKSDLKKLAWVIVICSGYVCFEMNMHYFRGFNYVRVVGFARMDNNSVGIGLVTALAVSGYLFLSLNRMWQQAIVGTCAALIGHTILLTNSRGAMLATGIVGGLSFLLIRKSMKHYAAFSLGALSLLILAGPEVRDRFWETFETRHGKHEESAQSRLDIWEDALDLFSKHPVTGVGPDHWPLHAESYGWEPLKEAHSLWVQTAAETGIPGIACLAGFYAFCIWRSFWLLFRIRREDEDWYADSCRMTIAGLIGFACAAQFVSLELLEIPYYVCLLGAGGLTMYSRDEREGLLPSQQQQSEELLHEHVSAADHELGSTDAAATAENASEFAAAAASGSPASSDWRKAVTTLEEAVAPAAQSSQHRAGRVSARRRKWTAVRPPAFRNPSDSSSESARVTESHDRGQSSTVISRIGQPTEVSPEKHRIPEAPRSEGERSPSNVAVLTVANRL